VLKGSCTSICRRVIGDRREAAHRAAGKDCYLFTLNDETIIDSTVGGNIARFTVRSHLTDVVAASLLLHAGMHATQHDNVADACSAVW
jgi:hypothetical protein